MILLYILIGLYVSEITVGLALAGLLHRYGTFGP